MEKEAAEMVIEIPQIDEMKAIAAGYNLDLKADEFDSILGQFVEFRDSWQMLADGPRRAAAGRISTAISRLSSQPGGRPA